MWQQVGIVVGCAEVEGIVDEALGGGILELAFEGFEGGCLRVGVRHVHIAGHASGSGCLALGVHIGLVCEAGVAEVHMVVDDSGDEVHPLCVDGFIAGCGGLFALSQDFGYHLVFYHDGAAEGLSFVHDAGVMDVCSFHGDCLFLLWILAEPAAPFELHHAEEGLAEDAAVHLRGT